MDRQELAERLSDAFGEPIHIDPQDYLEKVLAGLFCRMPDMSGDQRQRLNSKELRAVQDVAGRLIKAFAIIRGDEGWRLVPVEPTLQMREAGASTPTWGYPLPAEAAPDWDYLDDVWDIYRAMIDAAPSPPKPVVGVGLDEGDEK